MQWFNNFLMKVVPLAPQWAVGLVAKKYIAGVTISEAVNEIEQLQDLGFVATTDVLGESIKSIDEAQGPLENYFELLDTIAQQELDSGISVKLSQLGLKIDKDRAWENFRQLLKKAQQHQKFVRIDMEEAACN